MSMVFQQTDTAAPAGAIAACSGAATNSTTAALLCTVGGAAGSTPATVGGANFDNGDVERLIHFELTVPAGTTWGSGNWTVNINVTTAQASVTWSATYICRLNSANVSQETLGSLTGQTTSFATTGTKTHTVSQGSTATPSVGDKVYIVCVLTAANNNRQIAFTPSLTHTAAGFVAGGSTFSVTPSDSLGTLDTAARKVDTFRALAESLGLSTPDFNKSETRVRNLPATSLGLGDDVTTALIVALTILVTDSLALSDDVSRHADAFRALADNLGISDSVSRHADALRSVADSLGLVDTVSRHADALRSLTDSLGLSDSAARQVDTFRFISDLLAIGDSVSTSTLAALAILVSENLGLSTPDPSKSETRVRNLPATLLGLIDTPTTGLISGALTILVMESLGLVDGVTRHADALRLVLESLGLETATVETEEFIILNFPAEMLGISDNVTAELMTAVTLTILIMESLGITDTVQRQANTFRALSDLLALSDNVARKASTFRALSDSLGLSDNASRKVDYFRLLSDFLAIGDSAATLLVPQGVAVIMIMEALGLTDTVTRKVSTFRLLQEFAALSDTVARRADALRSISDLFGLDDDAARRVDSLRSISDFLGLTDSASASMVYSRSITDFLAFTDLLTATVAPQIPPDNPGLYWSAERQLLLWLAESSGALWRGTDGPMVWTSEEND